MYGGSLSLRYPESIVIQYHPVVTDWINRVNTAGGTASTVELLALNQLVNSWESDGLIESGLTSGTVSTSSTIQYALPCCGSDSIAARTALIYRSGSNSIATQINTPVYNSTTKSWTGGAAPGGGLNTGYVYSAYTSSSNNGFICVRTNTNLRSTGYAALSSISSLYSMVNVSRAVILPNFSGLVYGQIYNNTTGLLSYTLPSPSSTQQVILRNTITTTGSSASLYLGNSLVSSGTTTGGSPPSTSILLGAYDNSDAVKTETEPYTFFACSVTGIPTSMIVSFINSINVFRTSLEGSAL